MRIARGWPLLALACCAAQAVHPTEARAATTTAIAFKGAQLGMTEAAWKALAPPGPVSPNARPACTDDPGGAPPGLTLTPAERSAGAVACAYLSTYGRVSLPQSFVLDGKYRLTGLRFSFVDGRLAQIRCRTSTDAYSALVADFNGRYGPAAKLIRDNVRTELGRIPRVVQTWSTPTGSVVMTDPVPPYTELGLTFSAGAPKTPAERPKIATR